MEKHVKYPLYHINYTSKTQYQQQLCKELMHMDWLLQNMEDLYLDL